VRDGVRNGQRCHNTRVQPPRIAAFFWTGGETPANVRSKWGDMTLHREA
jgi:hypothetical protein